MFFFQFLFHFIVFWLLLQNSVALYWIFINFCLKSIQIRFSLLIFFHVFIILLKSRSLFLLKAICNVLHDYFNLYVLLIILQIIFCFLRLLRILFFKFQSHNNALLLFQIQWNVSLVFYLFLSLYPFYLNQISPNTFYKTKLVIFLFRAGIRVFFHSCSNTKKMLRYN